MDAFRGIVQRGQRAFPGGIGRLIGWPKSWV
jgi:hypothetical protein